MQSIEHGDVAVTRQSDRPAGGRWLHSYCIPGGLRVDDKLQQEGNLQPQGHLFIKQHHEKVARHRHEPPQLSPAPAPAAAKGKTAAASTTKVGKLKQSQSATASASSASTSKEGKLQPAEPAATALDSQDTQPGNPHQIKQEPAPEPDEDMSDPPAAQSSPPSTPKCKSPASQRSPFATPDGHLPMPASPNFDLFHADDADDAQKRI